MLVERFRPQKFEDIICRDAMIAEIKVKIASPDGIPNLLFYGLQGSGKTTMAHVIANELYGNKKGSFFHEINASSDRGIEIIREKVTDLCKVKPMDFQYKIIFMDEADYLTPEAQAGFRRLIETYHKTVRFIFTCNQVYRLIPAIISRFVKYECSSFDAVQLAKRLKKIVVSEKLSFDDKRIIQIAKNSKGDIRSAINMLEGAASSGDETWESMTWSGLLSMDKNERIKMAFTGDPEMIFIKVWELIQENAQWHLIDMMADTQAKMNYAAIKNVFIANMLSQLK